MDQGALLKAIYQGRVFGNGTVFRTSRVVCTEEVNALLQQGLASWYDHSEPVVLTHTGKELARDLIRAEAQNNPTPPSEPMDPPPEEVG